MIKKYPIGTKIRFLYRNNDLGKRGKIVAIRECDGCPYIYLPTGIETNRLNATHNGIKYSYICNWSNIVPLVLKNQQLLFSFMD